MLAAAGNKIFTLHSDVKGLASRDQLLAVFIPDCDRVHRTRVARGDEPLARDRIRCDEYRDARIIEAERLRRLVDAVAESNAQRPIYPYA